MNIHLSNLNIKTTADDIRQIFPSLENVTVSSIKHIRSSFTQIVTTFAYICIVDEVFAVKAIEVLNYTILHGSKIVARQSK